ncbi:MAG: PAS domain S-box protein [Steroidobacteraceae bacterium]|nr:PAS domain S-box protein [Deltaproteobacteria bacterium]
MKLGLKDGKASIKTKVAVVTFLTVSILVIAVSATLFSYFHTLLKESIFRQQFMLVSEIAAQLNGRIELARHQLSLAATDINSQVLADPQKIQQVLTHASPAQMIFDAGFLVIGTDGRVIAENMGNAEVLGIDLAFRDYVREPLRTGAPYISAPFSMSIPPHTPMIAMVVPVRDNSDRIICLLAGYHTLGADQFLTSLSSERIGTSGYLYLLHGRTLLMHPDSKRILERIPAGVNPGIDKALQGFEGSLDNVNSKGQRMVSSFKKVGRTGWILAANIPYEDAFRPLNKVFLNAIAISIFGIVLSIVVVWYVTRRLTLPIRKLTAHVDSANAGANEWQPIELATGDEIGRLALAFNTLMKEVHDAKQALKDEKNFYSGIIQNSAAPMFVIDRNHKIIFWNSALAKLTGNSSFQMTGTRQQWTPFYPSKRPVLADLVIDHTLERVNELYSNHSTSLFVEGSLRAEGWYEHLGGKRRYIFFEAAPIRNSNNEIVAAVETLEDITDRRLLEESLARLTRAVEQSPATIVITDMDGIIEYVNPKFCQTTGYTAEEAIGQHTPVLVTGEMSADDYAELCKTISCGKEWRGEFHNKRKDGTLYWEFASISPLYDQDGRIIGYLAVKEDITERKAVEAELAQNRLDLEAKHVELGQLFEQVAHGKLEWEQTLDHLHDFVILTDAEHRIRRCNKLLSDITCRPVKELIGLDWRELLAESGLRFVNFNGTSGEIFHQSSGRSYDINIYQIKDSGLVTAHVVSINDTTDLRATTLELQKAYAELKEAQMQVFQQEKMASIGQLAAGVAHEINNPMGFISSNLSTLTKYVDRLAEFISAGDQTLAECTDNPGAKALKETRKRLKIDYIMEDARQLIIESQDGAGRVRRIVQDLKSFSRVDQAESALVNLNEALETTINIAWNEIKYVATLNREFGDIPQVTCYPQQVNQVFLNLLVNAAHAIGENQGIITVRTWGEEENVFVSVTDTGCGIPKEIQQRIFEPFFTTKEVGKGTGLGLSISYDIICKHGGEITVESEVGSGSTFTVRLPLKPPQQVAEMKS